MLEDSRKQIASVIASAIITVAIPSLVFAMIRVDPSWGWPLVGICILLSCGMLIWGFSKHHLTDWRQKMWPLGFMAVGFAIYSAGAIWYFMAHYKASASGESAQTSESPLPLPALPSIPSLFMNDFKGKGSGGGLVTVLIGYSDLTLENQSEFRVFFNVIEDFGSRSKFVCFYVPKSPNSFEAIKMIAPNVNSYLLPQLVSETAVGGVPGATKSSDLKFTGRVFVYYDETLTLSQLGQLDQAFRDRDMSAEFRGRTYALAVWESIRSGDIKEPPRYELHGNQLQLASEQKKQQ